jgi:hypothetical protein
VKLQNRYKIEENEDFCEISICIENDSIILRFTAKVVKRSNKKLLIQSMIQREIFLFFMSCINLTCDIVLKTFATFIFSKMIIRFVFCFHMMWICSMKSFKVVSINRLFRHFMNVSNNNRCVFVIYEIFLFMMNFRIFSMMFNNAIDRYVFEIV